MMPVRLAFPHGRKGRQCVAQSYSIRVQNEGGRRVITVCGADEAGAMYGGLDIAEAIRTGTLDSLKDADKQPTSCGAASSSTSRSIYARPATRTAPTRAGEHSVMWEREFWAEFLDAMARHRYNVLSLWSLHPFPSLVKVPEFPDVALADVWRTRAKLDDSFSMAATTWSAPPCSRHEVVKRMTIDEKIGFWRWVCNAPPTAAFRSISSPGMSHLGRGGQTRHHERSGQQDHERVFPRQRAGMLKTYPLLAGMASRPARACRSI